MDSVIGHARQGIRHAWDCVALLLAVAAIAVQAIAPVCLYGIAPSGGAGGVPIVLCTAHGFQTVTLDQNGKPVPAAPDKGSSDGLCPMCVAFHAAPPVLLAAALLLGLIYFWFRADPVPRSVPIRLRRAAFSFDTRGPPAAFAV